MKNILLSPDETLTSQEKLLLSSIADEISHLVARAQNVL